VTLQPYTLSITRGRRGQTFCASRAASWRRGKPGREIVAWSGPHKIHGSLGGASDSIAELCDSFGDTAAEYEDSEMARKPRLSELLTSLEFVLRYRPEDYLSPADRLELERFDTE